ncbi:MAG TPA: outer membrane beta-barrel protein [Verrucomicrobiae bacterium]|nr:outer membrane beta-barrel protein [Verrucomicrobiae bacterium]
MRRPWGGWLPWPLLWLAVSGTGFAAWELTPPGDVNRFWSTSLTLRGIYDTNWQSAESNPQSGFRFGSDLLLRANIPLERMFLGLRYDYGVLYPRDPNAGGADQTHDFSAFLNYSFTPRLLLSLNNHFIYSLQPQLVQTQAGVPVTIVQAGTYYYDTIGGTTTYALTPRWTLALNGSWDIWRYEEKSEAQFNDREDYQTTLSAYFAFDPRTTGGLNFQYVRNEYTNPGTNSALNARSYTEYLSVVRRFNPQLSLQLNGGFTYRESDSGDVTTGPSAFLSLAYDYGRNSTVSATFGSSLSSAGVNVTRQYASSQNTSFALQVNHQVTTRLRFIADGSYVYSNFKQPVAPTFTVSGNEQSIVGHVGLNYALREWLSAVADYTYTELISDVPGLPYNRNQISVGVTLTY